MSGFPGEYLKIRYSAPTGACKCGNCQLVPPEKLAGWDTEIRRLWAENEKLRVALLDCATDLQASVTHEYAGTLDYPVMLRKYERDMEPVYRARALLGDQQTSPDTEK
jgi:hypothetical protein